jgi:diguanylate cyclase (GGDEF)-like protein
MINRRVELVRRLQEWMPTFQPLATAARRGAAMLGLMVILWVSCASAARVPGTQTQSFSAAPRNIQFTHLSQLDGLSQNAINVIAQDQTGTIWIGTQEGLNRYNGYEFTVYEHGSSDPESLSNNWVWDILVDRSGTIWIGTDGGGLERYDAATDTFEHFRHDPNDARSLSSDRVRAIVQDRRGFLWIGTDGGGLNRLDISRSRFTRFQHDPTDPSSLPNNRVLSIFEDERGAIWVGTDGGGIAIFDPAAETFRFLRHDPTAPDSLSSDRVRSIYQDRQQQIWIGTSQGGLNRFDPATQTFQHFRRDPQNPQSISDDNIRALLEDRQGTLWIATDSGLNEWRPSESQFVVYRYDATDPGSLANNRVTALMQDQGGVLWVGTYNGISKWNYTSDAFNYSSKDPALSGSVGKEIVSAITQAPNGDLWVGTYGQGLNRIEAKTGQVFQFPHGQDNPQTLGDTRIMALWVDPTGIVWVGTRNKGLNRLDPRTGQVQRFEHDPADPYSLSANGVTSLLGDPDGTLWVGTYGGGLNRLEPGTHRFHHYRHQSGDRSSLSSDRVLIVMRESAGDLWVGTEDGGLNRLDQSTGSFISYRHDPDDATSLSSDSAWELVETRDGAFWIGTMGGGLNRWDRADRRVGRPRFTRYTKADGLVSDTIHGILEAADGALWLSSNRGLTRFVPNLATYQHFDQGNGLQGSEFNHGARLLARDGVMYFGGTEGLVFFDPANIRQNQHAPTVVVTARDQLKPLGSSNSSNPLPTPIQLDYRSNFIAFDFAALDYASPPKNQYRYQLDGLDKDWINPGGHRRITYSNLPPGDYFFQVKGSNNDGIWSEQPARLALHVVPPPWRTIQAYVLYGLLVLAIIGSFFYREHRKLNLETRQRILMEREVALRTREIAERNLELEKVILKLETASLTDSLTGLRNRRFLYDFIEKTISEIEATSAISRPGQPQPAVVELSACSLFFVMIDLDGFKEINDKHGHHSGDMALLQVGDILRSCCGTSEHIIRWGGDEFLIVGRQQRRSGIEELAERIRQRLAEHPYQIGGGRIGRLSGSIGFACYPFVTGYPQALTWEQVIGIADHASYIAKNTQRNAWVGVYSTPKTVPDDLAARIKSDLEQQVALGQLRITSSIRGQLLLQDRRKKEKVAG